MKRIALTTLVAALFAMGTACEGTEKTEADKKPAAKKDAGGEKGEKKGEADPKAAGEAGKAEGVPAKGDAAKGDDAKGDDAKGAMPEVTHVAMAVHKVKDFDAWKKAFDAHGAERAKATGASGAWVFQMLDDPNNVIIAMGGTDPDKFKAFLGSPDLAKAMTDAGVEGDVESSIWELKGAKQVTDLSAVQGTAFVLHEVEDYDKWRKAFDAHEEARTAGGVLGWGVAVDVENPNHVGVRLDLGDLEKAKSMMESDDMKKAMADAGVKGEPRVMMSKMVPPPEAAAGGAAEAAAPTDAKAAPAGKGG